MDTEPGTSGPDDALFGWRIEHQPDATVVRVKGEIDLATGPELTEAAGQALSTTTRLLVLDLTEVVFMGSLGMNALIRIHQTAESEGRVVRVVPSRAVRRTVEIAGLDQILDVFDSVGQALTP